MEMVVDDLLDSPAMGRRYVKRFTSKLELCAVRMLLGHKT